MSKPRRTPAAASPDQIAIIWHTDDVKEVRPDLSDDQCREVLERAEDKHDAGIGINWNVLEMEADHLFPQD